MAVCWVISPVTEHGKSIMLSTAKHNSTSGLRRAAWVGSLFSFSLAAGCVTQGTASRPQPAPSVESVHPASPLSTLDEFVQVIAQDLAHELPSHPMIRESKHRQVLGVGPINVVGFEDRAPFIEAVASLRSRIMRNEPLQNAFLIVETRDASASDLLASIGGPNSEFLAPDGSNIRDVRPSTYHPNDVFAITGSFASISASGGKETAFRFECRVVHPRSGAIIYTKDVRRSLVWNAARRQWDIRD
jgi:hypothetical protein